MVVVTVDMRYYRKQLLGRTFVCGRNPSDGEWGLGIFVRYCLLR